MKKVMMVIGAICLSHFSFAGTEIKGEPKELEEYLNGIPKTITLDVSVNEKMTSNKALIKLVVETKDSELSSALEENAKTRAKVRKELIVSGVKPEAISESKFSSTPEYGFFGDSPKSYKVSNVISVLVESEEQMVQVASISDDKDSVRYVSSKAEFGEREKLKAQLLEKALVLVKAKAKIYENSLGVKLSPIYFEESMSGGHEKIAMPRIQASKLSSYVLPETRGHNVSFGEMKFTLTLIVKYKLTDGE